MIKLISKGKIQNGIFFQNEREYGSVWGGVLTSLIYLIVIAAAVYFLYNFFIENEVRANLELVSFDLANKNRVTVQNFMDEAKLSFNVKAYSFWDEINEPLVCDLFDTKLVYKIPGSYQEESTVNNV
jgi:hypothetical protein